MCKWSTVLFNFNFKYYQQVENTVITEVVYGLAYILIVILLAT